jgi:Ca2+-binding RTX toxin-like protein
MAILGGTNSNDFLLGSNEFDILFGLGGNDVLNGGLGPDGHEGGAGDDVYVIDHPEDIVIEFPDQGNDVIDTSISFNLETTPHVENVRFADLTSSANLNLRGNALNNALSGNAGDNILEGLAGDDLLRGYGGNDILKGGEGNDTFNGGEGTDQFLGELGDDLYIIADATDVVTEAADAGTDTVQASISYVLGANVENLTLTGTGNLNGTGNELNNVLTGNAGNNILDGKGGTDTLSGGLGNDTYIIGDSTDVAIEAARAGVDTVRASVSYVLRANVENLTLTGSGNIRGTGNSANNLLIGNAGVNVLNGAAGNDILFSGAGRDTMIGGAGADSFVLSAPRSGIDRIQDFNKQQGDRLVVDVEDFPGLTTGRLRANQFVNGTQALDQNDRFIYNQRNGALFYDADGRGGVGQVRIATLGGNPDLTATDIIVVASPF